MPDEAALTVYAAKVAAQRGELDGLRSLEQACRDIAEEAARPMNPVYAAFEYLIELCPLYDGASGATFHGSEVSMF